MTTETEAQLATAVLQKWRFSASYDSLVVNQNLVLRHFSDGITLLSFFLFFLIWDFRKLL